jgi:hypothetical protein
MKQITSILLLFALSLPLILLGQGYHRSAKVGVTLSPNPASVHGGSVCIEINAGQDSSYQKTPVTIQLYNLIGKQVGASITGHHISNNGCEIELTLPPGTDSPSAHPKLMDNMIESFQRPSLSATCYL